MYDILPELNSKDYIQNIYTDYDIRFCKTEEVGELVSFIDTYWKKNHIFALSKELLDWQHYDAEKQRYNFVISKHKTTGEIHSILGFVPTSQFDKNISSNEIWLCIWMARSDIHVKGLGGSLLYYLKSTFQIETISQLGISDTNKRISEHWNFKSGIAKQYYFPNPNATEVLSANRESSPLPAVNTSGWQLKALSEEEYRNIDSSASVCKKINRYKSKNFYINRYLKHPMYQYLFFAILCEGEISSIVVARECENGLAKCLRIVDYIGDTNDLSNVRYDLQQHLETNGYEYIDFVGVGLSAEAMKNTGFINRNSNPKTIIPHYFEPFVKKNVDLTYAFKTVNPEVTALIYKGDSDQDRPNIVKRVQDRFF